MPNLLKRRQILQQALVVPGDSSSEASAASKRHRTDGIDQPIAHRHRASSHVDRHSPHPNVSGYRRSPSVTSFRDQPSRGSPAPSNASRRHSRHVQSSIHPDPERLSRQSPALSDTSRRSRLSAARSVDIAIDIEDPNPPSRVSRPPSSVIAPSIQGRDDEDFSVQGSAAESPTAADERQYDLSQPRERTANQSRNSRARNSDPYYAMNDRIHADVSRIVQGAYNATLSEIEHYDYQSLHDEAYKRVVANAMKKSIKALKRLEIPPRTAQTTFNIKYQQDRMKQLKEQLGCEVDEYIELELAAARTEEKFNSDKARLEQLNSELEQEQARYKAERESLLARHPTLEMAPAKGDYVVNLLKYPSSMFGRKST